MAERKVVVELVLASDKALVNLGRLEVETKEYNRELKALNATIATNGKATREQELRVAQLSVGIRRNQTVIRELKNDLSGATAAGLRFRDKMAEASRAGLGAFGLGTLGVAGAVTGLVAVLRGAVSTLATFEQGNANLASILGVSVKEIDSLKQSAIDLGPALGRLPAEVTELQTELAKLGFTVPQILAAQEAVILLANATGESLPKSAEVAAATLKGFDLTAADTQRIVDVMAESFNKTSLDLEKFSVAMSTLAPSAKAAGFSIEETTSLVGILADRGLDASVVGTSLRSIFIDLSKTGRTLDDALAEINGSTNKTKTAFELFGERAAGAAVILAENIDQSDKLAEAFANAGGAAETMGDTQLNTLVGASDKLASSWSALLLEGGKLNDILKALALTSADFIGSVSDASDGSRSFADRAASATDALTFGIVSAEDYTNALSAITFGYFDAAEGAKEVTKEVAKASEELGKGIGGTAPEPPVVRTIKTLRDELTKLKEDRDALAVDDTAGLAANSAQVAALEKQIKALDGTTKSVKKLSEAQRERARIANEEQAEADEKFLNNLREMQELAEQPTERLTPRKPTSTPLESAQDRELERTSINVEEMNRLYEQDRDNHERAQQAKLEANANASAMLSGSLAELFDQQSAEYKLFAVAQAAISAYLGANYALADQTLPTFARFAAAASALLIGLANVKRIQGFASGGIVKDGEPIRRSNGDDVLITAKRGEVILNEGQKRKARTLFGDDIFHRIGIPGFATGGRVTRGSALVNFPSTPRPLGTGVNAADIARADLARAIMNMPAPQVSFTEFSRVEKAVRVTQDISRLR